MNFWNKLTANIFGNNINRVEHDVKSNWWMMSDLAFNNRQQLFWYSVNNPVLCTVLSTRAHLFSQMKITHLRNDNEVENSSLLRGLSNPNYFQSQQDWLFNLNWFSGVYGTALIYYNSEFLDKNAPKFLINLNMDKVDFNNSFSFGKFLRTKQDISDFENRKYITYTHEDGKQSNLYFKDLLAFYDSANGIDSLFLGQNKLTSLLDVLDNIQTNIESKNVNLNMSKKYIGVNKTDMHGQPHVSDTDRQSIRSALGSSNIQLTNGNIDFKHLVSDFKNLYLDEMYQADAMTIINAYGLNIDVINYALKNSTFSNQELGIVRVIQNNIQLQADNLMNSLSNAFQLPENEKLIASYDHLPVMQKTYKEKIEVLSVGIDAINKAKESGLIEESDAKAKLDNLFNRLSI